jgi:hypothetical protein
MSNGSDIAAQVNAALAQASAATGSGVLIGTIRRRGPQSGPSYEPVYGPDTLHTFNVVLGSFSERERAGTTILATDTKITAGASDVVPATSDRMVVRGVTYDIHKVNPLNPGGTDLKYTIWARD